VKGKESSDDELTCVPVIAGHHHFLSLPFLVKVVYSS